MTIVPFNVGSFSYPEQCIVVVVVVVMVPLGDSPCGSPTSLLHLNGQRLPRLEMEDMMHPLSKICSQ